MKIQPKGAMTFIAQWRVEPSVKLFKDTPYKPFYLNRYNTSRLVYRFVLLLIVVYCETMYVECRCINFKPGYQCNRNYVIPVSHV